jgi:TPR repeat protein
MAVVSFHAPSAFSTILTIRLQSYFQVAARLGDADAQQELGFCLANGKGCKKDRKQAAKWYRAAVRLSSHYCLANSMLNFMLQAEQGASTVGLAWIYKEKYR